LKIPVFARVSSFTIIVYDLTRGNLLPFKGIALLTKKVDHDMGRSRKHRITLKPKLFTIHWYPSSRSCVSPGGRKVSPQQMPPLMVRKAEWRR